MMVGIAGAVQTATPGAVIQLWTLDTTKLGGGLYRWTPSASQDVAAPISFGGNVYSPRPIEATGMGWSGQGSSPRPTIKIANVDRAITALVVSYPDLIGCKVQLITTLDRYLDGFPDADSAMVLSQDIWYVEQKLEHLPTYVSFSLRGVLDMENKKIPARQALRMCSWIYRRWDGAEFDYSIATCPYTGDGLFTRSDGVTTDPAQDSCSHQLSGCKARFGSTADTVLPYGGFVSMAQV